MDGFIRQGLLAVCIVLGTLGPLRALAGEGSGLFVPEQRHLEIRRPSQFPRARLPAMETPPTVATDLRLPEKHLGLDAAIQTALANSQVVRVLAGTRAASSGSTIHDPAIANTQIDQARGRFDPTVSVGNVFSQQDNPLAFSEFDAQGRPRYDIAGITTERYDLTFDLSQRLLTGGQAGMRVNSGTNYLSPGLGNVLNPQSDSSTQFYLTQPLLQGAGAAANVAPILLARIDTERSYFQLKDNVQRLVEGVVQAYWTLVAARTEVWARQQQTDLGELSARRAEARLEVGLGDLSEVAQARSALANFRANLLASRADLIQRESALRELLGLPPHDGAILVPVTPPIAEEKEIDWQRIVTLAECYRPDLIELKLVIEADQQRLLMARNQALPRLDASAVYQWNGLAGRTPDQRILISDAGDFTGWQLGVNFSVPLGLRAERAAIRQQELLIARDRAYLHQGLHNAVHDLATAYRNLDWYYEQYRAFQEARAAAQLNLDRQLAASRTGEVTIFLNVLQAIIDWGNAVTAESQALAQYNTELASLAVETGTILDLHGIRFCEERYGSIGPLGRHFPDVCYPAALKPGPNAAQYPESPEPAEHVFDLRDPLDLPGKRPAAEPEIVPTPPPQP